MALGYVTAGDIANAALDFYVRGKVLSQTTRKKPLLKWLMDNEKTFPGGKLYVSSPVQGTYMADTPGFMQGYTSDDQLTFGQAANILRAQYPWKEAHMGLIITWSELKQDGITISDQAKVSEHSRVELTRLTGILENRLDDFSESRARAMNSTFWLDGSQDAKLWAGVLSGLTQTPDIGTTGGLNRATYPWWRHRLQLNIAASGATQNLTKTLRSEARQLAVFGGQPDKVLAGSKMLEALEVELTEKGVYTMEGFANKGSNELGVADIRMRGIGTIEFDPTLDQLAMANFMFVFDSRRIKARPMEDEAMKMLSPTRPYNYAVYLRSITETYTMEFTQLNSCGVYSVAV